ncbi:xanthine dehydrogenase family protein subunit M [Spirosoma sp. HMF4905]|uniref:Xanthine dehydrogenase family protein subunit M n=1 Tax=Spirosoma arboris TaxID=2682092 RepID=A0A7K1SI60_9BACT|nr:xanthine dehydrogenase family protein subunit M [Spirosoma arboris]MVM33394.1 xanthine dehydrogenase family protein subunit M [Spirosoma arboris]
MNSFTYARASGITQAVVERSAKTDAAFIAGGTNLLDLMKENVARPTHLIDINHLPLTTITSIESGGLRLGALVTNADTAYHQQVTQRYPLLSQAILAGASAQLRNMATDGGNLMQRTRCYYFYDTATPCNKREPGSGCSAITGFNRIHAILGTYAQDQQVYCIATHPSDMCVALAALEAVVRVTGPDGDRTIPLAEFHRLPGDTPHLDNVLQDGELITAIDLPADGFPDHYAYLKLRDRSSYAFALVSVAAALDIQDGQIKDARIALGGVAHRPWRRPDLEATLTEKAPNKTVFQYVADAMLEGAQGFGHNTFKIELAKRAIVRALLQATNRPSAV